MKYIMAALAIATLWLSSAIEQGVAGAWAKWCLFGMMLWWTGFAVCIKLYEGRERKCRTTNRVPTAERT